MASRMDRYYKSELVTHERSSKNKNLYEKIQELDNYSNIEGVANIENSNEIDISKVKEMLNKRENYNNKNRYDNILNSKKSDSEMEETLDETRSYDINSVLNKVRQNSSKEKYRSLDDEQYEELKNIKNKHNLIDFQKEEDELKELIETLHAFQPPKFKDTAKTMIKSDDDVGLLDDLKSDTMVGDASSIKSILEEEKKSVPEEKDEIDKSFYSKSFGFTSSDFEELKDMNHKIKKGNKFIIILLVVLILLISAIAGIVFLPKFLP